MAEFDAESLAELIQKAAGGKTVAVYQLLKGGLGQGKDHPIELTPDLKWYRLNRPNCVFADFDEDDREAVRELWQHAAQNPAQIVYLEGLGDAIKLGIISQEEVDQFINDRAALILN